MTRELVCRKSIKSESRTRQLQQTAQRLREVHRACSRRSLPDAASVLVLLLLFSVAPSKFSLNNAL